MGLRTAIRRKNGKTIDDIEFVPCKDCKFFVESPAGADVCGMFRSALPEYKAEDTGCPYGREQNEKR